MQQQLQQGLHHCHLLPAIAKSKHLTISPSHHLTTSPPHVPSPPPPLRPPAPRQARLGPALALLGFLAEEVEQQERARRSAAVVALEPSRAEVLALMQLLLLAAVGGAAPGTLVRPSLQCLGHWLQLGGEESSGYALSPRQLLEQAPHLLQVGAGEAGACHMAVVCQCLLCLMLVVTSRQCHCGSMC